VGGVGVLVFGPCQRKKTLKFASGGVHTWPGGEQGALILEGKKTRKLSPGWKRSKIQKKRKPLPKDKRPITSEDRGRKTYPPHKKK